MACRRHTSLSSSCSTSSLIWKLDKLFAVNNNEEARNSLVIKLLGKLIGLEIVHVACRRHTSLSSSCSTSSLVWKLDKLIAVNDDEEARNSLVIKRSASSLIWTLDNWLAFSINLLLPKHASSKRSNNDEEARNSLVIRLFDKLIGLEIGEARCCQQRRRSEKLPCHPGARQAHWSGNWTSDVPSATTTKKRETPLSLSCSTSSLVWKLDKWLTVGTLPCHQAARNAWRACH